MHRYLLPGIAASWGRRSPVDCSPRVSEICCFGARLELDLIQQAPVDEVFAAARPQYVFLSAGKVGGILANSNKPAEFIYDNLAIQTNVIDAAFRNGELELDHLVRIRANKNG
jgi:hypothetical protein